LLIWSSIFADAWTALVAEQQRQLGSLKNGGCGGYSVVNSAWIFCGLRFGNIVNAHTRQGAITIVGHAAIMLQEAIMVDAPERPPVTLHMRRVAE
jgi:hypothetical protein